MTKEEAEKWRAAAIDRHAVEGEIEFDTDAKVSGPSEDGAFVQAWAWVPAASVHGEEGEANGQPK